MLAAKLGISEQGGKNAMEYGRGLGAGACGAVPRRRWNKVFLLTSAIGNKVCRCFGWFIS